MPAIRHEQSQTAPWVGNVAKGMKKTIHASNEKQDVYDKAGCKHFLLVVHYIMENTTIFRHDKNSCKIQAQGIGWLKSIVKTGRTKRRVDPTVPKRPVANYIVSMMIILITHELNSLRPRDTIWGIKPLPEPMLTYYQQGPAWSLLQ